ncbi:hypothetical protein EZS27_004895 [termite gut metagenome]|uniref:Lipoprotein n=1 Tax=termite gut metagenome TaxID=433724 RepID=A0A5J4SNE6_9ZZZZ
MKKLILILIAGLFIISCDKEQNNEKSIFILENGEFEKNSFIEMKYIPNTNKIDFNNFNLDLLNLVKVDFPEANLLTLEINAGLKNTYIDLSNINTLIYTYSANNKEDLKITFIKDKVLYSLTKEKNKKFIGYINDIDLDIYSIVNRLIETTYGVSYLENIIIRQQTKITTSPHYKGGPLAIFYQGDDIKYVDEALACELLSKVYFRIFRKAGDF